MIGHRHDASGSGWRSRLGRLRLAGAVVLLTLLLHALALMGLVRGFDSGSSRADTRRAPVQVSLIPGDPADPVDPAAEVPAVAPTRPPVAPVPPAPPVRPADPDAAPADGMPPAQEPSPADSDGAGVPLAALDPIPVGAASIGTPGAPPEPAAVTDPTGIADRGGTAGLGASGTRGGPDAGATPSAAAPLYGVALAPLLPARSRFQVYYGEYTDNHVVALLDYTVESDGERYSVRTEGRAQGLTAWIYSGVLTQSSTGRIGADGLIPERYTEQRGKRPERWAAIDHRSGQASFSGGQRVAVTPGTQDRLSMLLQVGLIAQSLPQRLAAGQALTIPELGSRSVEPAIFLSQGDQQLETRSGPLRTLHLSRQDGDRSRDPRVEVWLGYDHRLAPVRIRLTDPNGRVLDQLLLP
jgi:hypothetical protein